jgi:threonine dehydratase
LVSLQDIVDAQQRLDGVAEQTPIVRSRIGGGDVVLKCENRQVTGSFKIRGAYNCASQLSPEQLAGGLVAISSGNHAQAVAKSAQLLSTTALIAMPEDSSPLKIERTRALGAEIVFFDRFRKDREEVLVELLKDSGRSFIPPYDHPHVIAGQGTAALELFEQAGEIDALIVPVSGGGLIAGCGIVAKAHNPKLRLIGVEPRAGDDTFRSLRAGERVWIEAPVTIADGLRAQIPGEVTFPINQAQIDEVVTVTDQAILSAVGFLRDRVGEAVEPSGAVGVAALLSRRVNPDGQRVGVILSGGNA